MGTKAMERATGARAVGWGEGGTYNVAVGCRNGCLYCYRRAEMTRFRQIAGGADWANERLKAKPPATPQGGKGQVMLPSGHDITPVTQEAVADLACRLLEARTPVGKPQTRLLLVTKPWGPSVQYVCERLELLCPRPAQGRRARVEWRLSIGVVDERLRAFWEPGAPCFEHRREVLQWLHGGGWRTSVSCEPLLDPPHALELVSGVAPWASETIWIGKCNGLAERTAWARQAMGPRLQRAVEWLQDHQTREWVCWVAQGLRSGLAAEDWAKVRFKSEYAADLPADWIVQDGRPVPGPP